MTFHIPSKFKNMEQKEVLLTKQEIIDFELRVKEEYEKATIAGPVHMSGGNEEYSRCHDLPLEFVIEDNDMSTNTPTSETWNGQKTQKPEDVFYYTYERVYPHHGTGQWILF